MNTNDGGPAFPEGNFEHKTSGMTLRDYFAAKAMQGIITDPKEGLPFTNDQLAQWSYQVADAMLKARTE